MSRAAKVQKYRVQFYPPSRRRWIVSEFSFYFQGEPLAKLAKAVQAAAHTVSGNGFRYRILSGKKIIRQFEPRS